MAHRLPVPSGPQGHSVPAVVWITWGGPTELLVSVVNGECTVCEPT